jgi:endonuclease YncB( thermonuclease family)
MGPCRNSARNKGVFFTRPNSPGAADGWAKSWAALIVAVLLLAGCGGSTAPGPGAIPRDATIALPTPPPTLAPSPANTRVMPLNIITPIPRNATTPTITPIPADVRGLVVQVLNGQTIAVVLQGDPPGRTYQVRYLGITTPPNSPNEPWGVAAFEANRAKTNLKVVRLVQDKTNFDSDGFLQRYVYVGDEFVNLYLVEMGLAQTAASEPDTQFQTEFETAQSQAQAAKRGLWGPAPTATVRAARVTPAAPITITITATAAPQTAETPEANSTGTPAAGPESSQTPATEPTPTPTTAGNGSLPGPP